MAQLKELELIKAVDIYCNAYPSDGGEDKNLLIQKVKNFTKDDIASTIDFVDATIYGEDKSIKTTLQKLNKARCK